MGIDQLYYGDDTQYAGHIRGKYKHGINLKQIENMHEKNPAIYRNIKYVGCWCMLLVYAYLADTADMGMGYETSCK